MNCDYHPSKKAVANCIRCEKFICEQCLVIWGGKAHCRPCYDTVRELEVEPGIGKQEEKYEIQVEESDKSPSHTSRSWMLKVSSVVLAVTLVVAVVYSVTVTRDRDALNTELESVKTNLTSTQAELTSTKQTLDSTQAQLNTTQAELNTTKETLTFIQNELGVIQEKLRLYEETSGTKIYSDVQPQYAKPDFSGVNLINNPNAANTTWQNVRRFLLDDPTDDEIYRVNSFNCTNFAEMVHNNAEAAGIRAAFVTIDFEGGGPGHALNSFVTTDQGLVYVDCTGQGFWEGIIELDKFAYVVKGRDYGLISMEYYFPGDYKTYIDAVWDWQHYGYQLDKYNSAVEAYNHEVKKFNREVREYEDEVERYEEEMASRIFPDLTWWWQILEWEREIKNWESRLIDMQKELKAQEKELDSLREDLKTVWQPSGIVSSIEIYW